MEWIKVGKRGYRSKLPIVRYDNKGKILYLHPEYQTFPRVFSNTPRNSNGKKT